MSLLSNLVESSVLKFVLLSVSLVDFSFTMLLSLLLLPSSFVVFCTLIFKLFCSINFSKFKTYHYSLCCTRESKRINNFQQSLVHSVYHSMCNRNHLIFLPHDSLEMSNCKWPRDSKRSRDAKVWSLVE